MPSIVVESRSGVGDVFFVTGVIRYEALENYVVGGVPVREKSTEHFGLKNLFCVTGGMEGLSFARAGMATDGTLMVFNVQAGQEWSDGESLSGMSATEVPFLAVGW